MRFLDLLITLAGLTASASAFTVNQPSAASYWVQFATNTVAWSNAPGDSSLVTLQIINPNADQLNGVFSIAEYVPASLESYTVTNVTLKVADGYVVQMVNPTNSSQIYASSSPFAVKPAGTAPAAGSGTGTSGSLPGATGMTGNMTNMTGMSGMMGNSTNGRPGNTVGFNNNPNGTANANRPSHASIVSPSSFAALSVMVSAIGLATL